MTVKLLAVHCFVLFVVHSPAGRAHIWDGNVEKPDCRTSSRRITAGGKRKRGYLRARLALMTPEPGETSGSSPRLPGKSCTCREFSSQDGSGTSPCQAEIQVGFWLLLQGPISLPESSNFQIWAFAQVSSLTEGGIAGVKLLVAKQRFHFPLVLSSFNPSFCITEPVLIVLL